MLITGTYTLDAQDFWRLSELQEIYLECDTTLAPVTINLFPISDLDRFWNVKIYISDIYNNASANNITINCDALDSINYSGMTNSVINSDGGRGTLFVLSENQWGFSNLSPIPYTAYDTIQNQGTPLTQRRIIDFIGNGVTSSDDPLNQKTLVDIPGGLNQAYTIVDDEGIALPQRSIIDFQGAGVTAADDALNAKTIVTIPGGGIGTPIFGSFYDTTTQTVAIGVPKAMELNSVDLSGGVTIANNLLGKPTRITVNTTGIYNLQFSAQLNRTSGGNTQQVDIWLRRNELDLPWTNTGVNVQANANKLVAAWNFFISLTANQYIELMWRQTDAIEILADPAGPNYPETPSVIVTMNKVN